MDIMFLLLGASLVVAILFLIVFIISVRSGQFDDLYTPSVRMLFDDTIKEEEIEENKNLNKSITNKSKNHKNKTTE